MPRPEDAWPLFRISPAPGYVIHPDAPDFTIIEINDALLRILGLERDAIVGKRLFEAFPDSSEDQSGQNSLTASLNHVLLYQETHRLENQPYPVLNPGTDRFDLKYWSVQNTPVLNAAGDVSYILHTVEDCTEQIEKANSLQQKEQHSQFLFDQNPDAVFLMNGAGYFTGANPAALQLTKYSHQEITNLHFTEVCLPEDIERIQHSMNQCLSGDPVGIQAPMITADGKRVELSINGMPVMAEGNVVGVYGIAKDQTKNIRRKKEKDLILSFGQIFNSEDPLADCLQELLNELCLLSATQAAEAWISSIDHKEFIFAGFCSHGNPVNVQSGPIETVNGLVEAAGRMKKITLMHDLQTNPDFLNNEFAREHNFLSGVAIPVIFKDNIVSIIVFYTVEPQVIGDEPIFSDLFLIHLASHIQRKKVEDELRQYFNLSNDMLCIAGLDQYFKKINPAFSKLLGYTTEEILAKPYYEFLHPDDRKSADDKYILLKDGNSIMEYESRFITKKGKIVWVSWSATTFLRERLVYCVGRDITEKKKLEIHLANEEQKFERMFAEAPVCMCVLKGKDHIFVSANKLYYEYAGKKKIIGKPVMEIFPDQNISQCLNQVYETGETFTSFETPSMLDLRGTGELEQFYVTFMLQAYRNNEGEIEGVFYFGVDVTAQVMARHDTEESEKKYADLIQSLPAAVYTTDIEGNLKLFNKATADLWGFTPQPGQSVLSDEMEIYTTDYERIPKEESPLAITLRTGLPVHGREVILKRPDGILRNVMPHPSPLFNRSRELLGGINILVDITDIKRTDEELRKLSLIAKNTDNAVIITTPHGKIEWVNEAFTRITGYTFPEAIGKPNSFFHGPDTNKAVVSFMKEKSDRKQSFECEVLMYTKSGKPIWMEIKHQPVFDSKGNLIQYFNIEADITERKNAYEKVMKSESEIRRFARQQNSLMEQERARIAREIHDEFGQQLTGLKMSLSSLKKQFDRHPENAAEVLTTVISDVDQSIQSLREFATDLRPGILDTLGLFPSIGWLAKDFEKKTGISCSANFKVNEEQFVNESLSICFFRICQEALTNVAKHSEANHVHLEMEQIKEMLSLKITDNGKGIVTDKINNPFSMGLLGMRERASLVGGELFIASYPNTKTTIHFLVNINNV